MRVSRPHPLALVAHHDPPLIDERAATRGRVAPEGGDEHAGVRRALSVQVPALIVRATADHHIALFAPPSKLTSTPELA
jgi:hypothetical protein